MEKNNMQRTKGKDRTTNEQLRYYVTFSKKYPELQTGKNCTLSRRAQLNMWEQLSKDLNGMRGPTRTVFEWKSRFLLWKQMVRCRVRKAKSKMVMTNAEPQPNKVSLYQVQAMEAFDDPPIEGIKGGMTFSFSKMQSDKKGEHLPAAGSTTSKPMLTKLSAGSELSLSQSSLPSSLIEVPSPLSSPSNAKSTPSNAESKPVSYCNLKEQRIAQILQNNLDNIETQNIRDEQMMASNLSIQKTFNTVTNSFAKLAEVLVKYTSSPDNTAQTSSSNSKPMDEWDKTALSLAEHMRNAINEFPHLADRFRVQLLEMSLDVQKERVNARSEEANTIGMSIDIKSEMNLFDKNYTRTKPDT